MTDYTMNELIDRYQVYDCFVQLQSGSDLYTLASLQKHDGEFEFPNFERVADDGTFYLNAQVPNHETEMDLILTVDEIDTVNPPTNTRTVSYYLYQKNLRNHVVIAVSLVMYAKDSSLTNKYARLNYSFELTSFGIIRTNGEGDVVLPIKGRILLNDPITGDSIAPTLIASSS